MKKLLGLVLVGGLIALVVWTIRAEQADKARREADEYNREHGGPARPAGPTATPIEPPRAAPVVVDAAPAQTQDTVIEALRTLFASAGAKALVTASDGDELVIITDKNDCDRATLENLDKSLAAFGVKISDSFRVFRCSWAAGHTKNRIEYRPK